MRRLINTSPRKVKRRPAKSVVVSVTFISSLCLDYKKGFGGSFGIQTDRVDKSAHGWEFVESVDKHASQTGETPLPCLSEVTILYRPKNIYPFFRKKTPKNLSFETKITPILSLKPYFCVLLGHKTPKFLQSPPISNLNAIFDCIYDTG